MIVIRIATKKLIDFSLGHTPTPSKNHHNSFIELFNT